ncbi:MAG: hypothetical protein NVS4B3_27040 [Gemmatimonadaceae bacterium]
MDNLGDLGDLGEARIIEIEASEERFEGAAIAFKASIRRARQPGKTRLGRRRRGDSGGLGGLFIIAITPSYACMRRVAVWLPVVGMLVFAGVVAAGYVWAWKANWTPGNGGASRDSP